MSIIEQATRRLEELKRAGVEVAWEPAPPAGPAGPPATPRRAAHALEEELGYALDLDDADTPAQPSARERAAGHTPGQATSSTPGHALMRVGAPPQSKSVTLDLLKLSELGYLVPGAPRSALVDEFRSIKQPLLKNARAQVDSAAASPSSSSSTPASTSASTPASTSATTGQANLIMVTSALAGEGKTFCAVNLALSIASEVDSSVLLVDADVICPSVMSRLGVTGQHKGLLDLLSDTQLTLPELILKTNIPKLSLLPAGAPTSHSTELLASDALGELLHEIATRYPERIVIFDAPPLLSTTESRVLATRMGQIIMVVSANSTQSLDLAQAYTALENCPTVLSVLNKSTSNSEQRHYGYYPD
jgi:protein-tyrosine kinase